MPDTHAEARSTRDHRCHRGSSPRGATACRSRRRIRTPALSPLERLSSLRISRTNPLDDMAQPQVGSDGSPSWSTSSRGRTPDTLNLHARTGQGSRPLESTYLHTPIASVCVPSHPGALRRFGRDQGPSGVSVYDMPLRRSIVRPSATRTVSLSPEERPAVREALPPHPAGTQDLEGCWSGTGTMPPVVCPIPAGHASRPPVDFTERPQPLGSWASSTSGSLVGLLTRLSPGGVTAVKPVIPSPGAFNAVRVGNTPRAGTFWAGPGPPRSNRGTTAIRSVQPRYSLQTTWHPVRRGSGRGLTEPHGGWLGTERGTQPGWG